MWSCVPQYQPKTEMVGYKWVLVPKFIDVSERQDAWAK